MNKTYVVLLIILLTGAMVRLWPAMAFDKPLRPDSYYHARIADLMLREGPLVSWEPWPYGGRPHIYPPLYQGLVASISAVSGAAPLDIVRFLLPVISSLTVLAAFWVTRKLADDRAGLIAALFIALNPALISTSYDSPQVIGLLLACFCVYFLFKGRQWLAGALLAVAFLVNTFSAACIAAALLAFLAVERRWREMPRLMALPALACALWYLPRYEALYCYNNSIGPQFISRAADPWIKSYTPTMVLFFVTAAALTAGFKERLERFWFVWMCVFIVMYLLNFVTPAFHPWRLDVFFFFGFSFLMASIFRRLDLKKTLFLLFFVLAGVAILYGLVNQQVFGPPFDPHEYALVGYVGAMPNSTIMLANHDLCASIMTFTNRTCLLDINFECMPDAERWRDLEEFFWASRPEQTAAVLDEYPATHVAYSSGDWGRTLLDRLEINKVYASWGCGVDCGRDANIYEVLRYNGSVVIR